MSAADIATLCTCLTEGLRAPLPALPRALTCLQLGPVVDAGQPCDDWDHAAVAAIIRVVRACPALRALDLHGASDGTVAAIHAAWHAHTGGQVLQCTTGHTRLWLPGFDVDGATAWPTEHVLPSADVLRRRQQSVLHEEHGDASHAAPVDAPQPMDVEVDSQPREDVQPVPRLAQRMGLGVWNPLEQERAAAAEEAALAEAQLGEPQSMPPRSMPPRSTQPRRQVCGCGQCHDVRSTPDDAAAPARVQRDGTAAAQSAPQARVACRAHAPAGTRPPPTSRTNWPLANVGAAPASPAHHGADGPGGGRGGTGPPAWLCIGGEWSACCSYRREGGG